MLSRVILGCAYGWSRHSRAKTLSKSSWWIVLFMIWHGLHKGCSRQPWCRFMSKRKRKLLNTSSCCNRLMESWTLCAKLKRNSSMKISSLMEELSKMCQISQSVAGAHKLISLDWEHITQRFQNWLFSWILSFICLHHNTVRKDSTSRVNFGPSSRTSPCWETKQDSICSKRERWAGSSTSAWTGIQTNSSHNKR